MSAFMIVGIVICALNWLFALPQVILYFYGSREHPFSFNLAVAIATTVIILKS